MTVRGWILAVLVIAVVALGAFGYPRFESGAPEIRGDSEVLLGREAGVLSIDLRDEGSGLRSFQVRLQSSGGTRHLFEESFPGSIVMGGDAGTDVRTVDVPLDPATLRLPDGSARLILTSRDWSLRDGFAGNRSELVVEVRIDTRAPKIDVISGLTYVYRGGSAAAVYQVDEPDTVDGVDVGGEFFRGYPLPGDATRRIALFAIPVEAPPEPAVVVVATDPAGNRNEAKFPARISERRFRTSNISLSDRFLQTVAIPLAESHGLESSDGVRAFQQVNRELRESSEARIREAVATSLATPVWTGAFEQMKNSKVMSRFAELRSYMVAGEKVSGARHYGYDLASTTGAPVSASNDGAVVLAEDLGIYGGCVILDHGMGLATLYAHLSSIDVAEGQRLGKGDRLGASGATGLAGGDHLHFAILVGETYVDPMEWWDPRWVQSHVTVRLR